MKLLRIFFRIRYNNFSILQTYCFQFLSDPSRYRINQDQDYSQDFVNVDRILSAFGFVENKKIIIYQLLSAVLYLGNIQFADEPAQIIESTCYSIDFAAKLLRVSSDELKEALLYNSIPDAGSKIR